MNKIKVLVADDHPAFREGLCRLLEEEKDLEVVARTADGEETVRLTTQLQPDVVVIDVAMPKLNGIEAARQIKHVRPETVTIMVSAFSYESYLVASLRAGAAGYLLKNAPVSELISAIRMVHSGQVVFDRKAMDNILGQMAINNDTGRRVPTALHARELEVLKRVAKGMTNRRIGEEFGISERTVQSHLVSTFRKLGVRSRTEAAVYALREGWITFDDLSRSEDG